MRHLPVRGYRHVGRHPWIVIPFIALLITSACAGGARAADSGKHVVGAIETVEVVEGKLAFRARVDTGAATTSVHAEQIVVSSTGNPKGKPISFRIVNELGDSRHISTVVTDTVKVRTSEGSERRYRVPLTIRWKELQKSVLVTLNDRAKMDHRLLLGRNWLRGSFVVDVALHGDE